MMQRRRPSSPSTATTSAFSVSEKVVRMTSAAGNGVVISRTGSFSAAAAVVEPQQQKPILPLRMVAAICAFFLTAGFLQHRYDDMSSRNPLVAGGRKMHHSENSPGGGAAGRGNKYSGTSIEGSLLTPDDDAALELDTANGNARYHVVFSTDCSPYQHWQSYMVFYTAMKVRQTGHVTRIASGCDAEQEVEMELWFQKSVQILSQRFHLHLTPKFSTVRDEQGNEIGDYKFFNKPYGLKHWMENADLLRYNRDTKHFPEAVQSDVVILIDPDMILLRPLTADFSDPRETLYGPARQLHKIADRVGPGRPFAQVYGFGTQWSRLDLEAIAGSETPAAAVSHDDARLYYPAGPPYLAVVSDMHSIAVMWSDFVAPTYAQYPHLLAEMFAYSIAAAHMELPHSLVDSLMVSDVTAAGGEGWALVDAIPPARLCGFCRGGGEPPSANHHRAKERYAVPSVLHMCQRYSVGEDWFFTKRRVPADIYDCDAPLFDEPPSDLAVRYDYKQAPGGKRFNLSQQEAVRQSFAICSIYAAINEAAAHYKRNACSTVAGTTINLEKTRNLVQYMADQKKKAKTTTTA